LIIEETSTGFKSQCLYQVRLYAALPASYLQGVLISTILTAKPFAGILVRGTVNKNASFYTIASGINRSETALPLIRFTQD
jgi:hypothetical protein